MPWPSPPRAACQHHPALPLLEGHCFDHLGRHALRSATLLRLTQRLVPLIRLALLPLLPAGKTGVGGGRWSCQATPCTALPLPPPCLPPFPLSHPPSLHPPRPWLPLDRPLSLRRHSLFPPLPPCLHPAPCLRHPLEPCLPVVAPPCPLPSPLTCASLRRQIRRQSALDHPVGIPTEEV